jgi:transposase-like protein
VEELLAERGIEVDHVTVYRWLRRFTPLFADAARPLRHASGRSCSARVRGRQAVACRAWATLWEAWQRMRVTDP